MDWGGVIAGALGGGANAVGQLADNYIAVDQKGKLMQMQADVELQKEKAIAQAKSDLARQNEATERTRVQGIAQRAQQSLPAQSQWGPPDESGNNQPLRYSPTQTNLAISRQAASEGDTGTAAAYDKLADSGQKNVAYGGVLVQDGQVVYDNSLGRQQRDLATSQAALTRAQAVGKPKALDQKQVNELQLQADKIVDARLGGMKNPFAMPGEEKETARDTARIGVVKDKITQVISNNAANGTETNVGTALVEINRAAEQADLVARQQARDKAKTLFDMKTGKPLSGVDLSELPASARDAASYMRAYRDENLGKIFDSIGRQMAAGGRPQAATAPAAEAPPPNTAAAGANAAPAEVAPRPVAAAERYRGNSFQQNQQAAADVADMRGNTDPTEAVVQGAIKQDAAQDPQLIRLYSTYKQMLAANRPTDANALLTQYNTLRKHRYNF